MKRTLQYSAVRTSRPRFSWSCSFLSCFVYFWVPLRCFPLGSFRMAHSLALLSIIITPSFMEPDRNHKKNRPFNRRSWFCFVCNVEKRKKRTNKLGWLIFHPLEQELALSVLIHKLTDRFSTSSRSWMQKEDGLIRSALILPSEGNEQYNKGLSSKLLPDPV